jgi:predicted TIM-barrel fold metal-dependent hydrolase
MAPSTNGSNGSHAGDKVVIVSCDAHIGPRVKDDLRPYCPEKYLDQFDDFVAYLEKSDLMHMVEGLNRTTGHYDPHRRLRDLDQDGTAAEVIFHGSQNGQPIPFNVSDFSTGSITAERQYDVNYEEAYIGRHIYNAWLADYCSVEPERHVGLAQLPMWDIDEAIKELEWAASVGLKGVNFPAESGPGLGTRSRFTGSYVYNDPIWDPFWSACEDLGMVLGSHGGAGNPDLTLPGGHSIWLYEAQEQSKLPIARLILGGVFERHPGLKMVVTEQPGDWWRIKMNDLDTMEGPMGGGNAMLPRTPSEYAKDHVFMGASFQARFEVEDAVANGYWTQCLWGNDYPHIEGTWKYLEDLTAEPYSHKQIRWAYHDMDQTIQRAILGLNACRVYNLDTDALTKVAQRINAPTIAQINTPLDEIPADHNMWAFRQVGAFG